MAKVFVQFSDAAAARIVSVFAGAQDLKDYPNFEEIDEGDQRYQAFLKKQSVPPSVTKRQGRLALLGAGKLSAVTSFIANLPAADRAVAEIEWDSDNYERRSTFLKQVGAVIGFTDEDLDDLFVAAAKL